MKLTIPTRWGYFNVLEELRRENNMNVKLKTLWFNKGENISYQKHFGRSEIWFVSSGSGTIAHEGKLYEVKQGDMMNIPVGTWHSAKANEHLEVVEIQFGEVVDEGDIERKFYDWNEMLESFGVANE